MGIVAKYKFDGSVYADLIPEFNTEFTDYTITDEVDSENSNHIIRTIESDSLPTLMRFGTTHEGVGGEGKSSLLEIIKLDTSNLTSVYCMFRDCAYVKSINTDGWNTSKITDMTSIFNGCGRLTSLDVSNLDISSAIYFKKMFIGCVALTSIDTSMWKTNKIIDTSDMFRDCKHLKLLDISNYDLTNVTLSSEMFTGTENLTDIGMIYCNKETVNKVASLLPTDHNITIWVESDDILQYDQYDHITYKTQKVQDTVHLNSPLLTGDTIEVIDGKTYHVHRYKKVVLDGTQSSDYWGINASNSEYIVFINHTNLPLLSSVENSLYCDSLPVEYNAGGLSSFVNECAISRHENINYSNYIYIKLKSAELKSIDTVGLIQYLSENPIVLIHKLATPYYELISEEPLELTLLDTTDNTINNNSILPSNMTIANKELSTIAIKSSTIYTLSFDKSNKDSEVTIDICGGEQITTVLNRVELTTPSELGSGIRFISSDGCIISNVRLLEGSLVKEAIPKETFEGLKSSFEDGYIIGENLIATNVSETEGQTLRRDFSKRIYKNATVIIPSEYVGKLRMAMCRDNLGWVNNYPITTTIQHFSCNTDEYYICVSIAKADITLEELANLDIIVLEGDHTHLSEAELMRYIEKGTSHYEGEDFNHVGKYKVQYKVTGKNKFDNKAPYKTSSKDVVSIIDTGFNFTRKNGNTYDYVEFDIYVPKGQYYLSFDSNRTSGNHWDFLDSNGSLIAYVKNKGAFILEKDCYKIKYYCESVNTERVITNLQIEEGTVATEYEPYKEDIRTYYLSSPLLEGDTIEDIDGVATHVKRRWIEKLDGTRDYTNATNLGSVTRYQCGLPTNKYNGSNAVSIAFPQFPKWHQGYEENWEHHYIWNNQIYIFLKNEKLVGGIKQWLSKNPTTLIYELASPIYEPISDESILCDSYVNGHLDVDSNIPIEKVKFNGVNLRNIKYLQPNTAYIVQFESDNDSIATMNLGATESSRLYNQIIKKGINTFKITLPSSIGYTQLSFNGIGFNASNIQVVAADRNADFGYFKGLQSSFENGLVTDENDENYGKYKVEVKIVGKNKFNGELEYGRYNYTNGIKDADNNTSYMRFPKLIPIKNGSVRATVFGIDGDVWFVVYNTNGGYIDFGKAYDLSKFDGRVGYISFYMVQPSFADNWYIQIEEGTQATPYEPYKESIHTLYLNSPLLKGDKLVVHNGKLCHYHKMGMVVLDGSSDESWSLMDNYTNCARFKIPEQSATRNSQAYIISDKFTRDDSQSDTESIRLMKMDANKGGIQIIINKSRLSSVNNTGLKQWLQANPTTVVYELAEPYYEPIEPQLSQYSFSAVKDGDMEIITVLPIEKINLTYRTDINGVSSIEEQIASIQEGTDISSIIDEEVDE